MISLMCMDMAGTTVADDGAVAAAFDKALAAAGIPQGHADYPAARDYAHRTMGRSKIEVFTELLPDAEAAEAANVAFERAYDAQIEQAAGVPGAEETMRACREAGIRVCLTTGFSVATRQNLLEALGWESLIDLALSPGRQGASGGLEALVARGRPHPDLPLTAALRLGVDDVRHVGVVGDTTGDLHSGGRAGAGVVAGVLTGAHGEHELRSAPLTHLLGSVAELPQVLGLPA